MTAGVEQPSVGEKTENTFSLYALGLMTLLLLDVSGVSFGGVPLSMLVLAVLLLAAVIERQQSLKTPSWLQIAFLAAACLGLISLDRATLAGGLREVVQCAAAVGVAFVVFGTADSRERRSVTAMLALLCAGLSLYGAAARVLPLPLPFHTNDPQYPEVSHARYAFVLCLTFPFMVKMLLGLRWKLVLIPAACLLYALAGRNGALLVCGVIGAAILIILSERKRTLPALALIAGPILIGLALSGSTIWDAQRPAHPDGSRKRLFIEYQSLPLAVAAAPVAGHGLGGYRSVVKRYSAGFAQLYDNRIPPDTNSTYALMAVDAGLPAAALLIAMLAALAWAGMRHARTSTGTAAAAGAAATLLLAGLFTPLFSRNTDMLLGAITGFAAAGCCRPATLRGWALRLAPICAVGVACLLLAVRTPAPVAASDAGIDAGGDCDSLLIESSVRGSAATRYWVFEAERVSRGPEGGMRIEEANDASGNRVLAIPEGAGKGNGAAYYTCSGIPAGSYTIWVRAEWKDDCSNSIGCIIGNQQLTVEDGIFGRMHWVKSLMQVSLPGGTFDLRLQNLEDAVKIDQLLFVSDGSWSPPTSKPLPPWTPPAQQ